MKKALKVFGFAGTAVLVGTASAFAAPSDVCGLINELGKIFKILRTLAFIGAGFYIAQWAWGFISKGDVKMDDVRDKGIGVLVGFLLLFSVGVILEVLLNMAGPGGSLGCNFDAWK